MRALLVLIGLLVIFPVAAQEEDTLDWDFGDLFYTPPEPPPPAEEINVLSLIAMMRPPGFTFDGTFEFSAGLIPGWWERPWDGAEGHGRGEHGNFGWQPIARMQTRFDIDAQISNILRVRTSLLFTVPGLEFELREFFFDYNLGERFFLRGGRFGYNWGISPNFVFANLIARVPSAEFAADPFMLRLNIPVGIGGFQFLALTRRPILEGAAISHDDVGYGARFNLALPRLDTNVGVFFQEGMPLRGSISFNTTFGRTEVYNEWLGAIDVNDPASVGGAVNIGFVHDFFRNRLTVNGELFFNTERDTYWFRPETNIYDAQALPFPDGVNLAFNLLYRFGGRTSPRIFLQAFYAPQQNSAQLVPGFRLNLLEHLELYVALPMALGDRDGHYFLHTPDPSPLNRPFALVVLLTIRGNVRIGQNH